MHPRDQTIFALASGRPPTAISIVRVSGPCAGDVLRVLSGKDPAPRVATRALLRDRNQGLIDDAIILWFPSPASATGEDVAEFHVHGGRAVLAALFAALGSFDDVRPAEPGEFTRRGFENGKLDLTEAEGLDDLIHADTDRQRRQALRQLNGLLGDRVRRWREEIIEASALIAAGIDFSDEGDVPAELFSAALRKVAALAAEIEEVLAAESHSERLRDGLVVAIAGPPNVGKSTLMNQLAQREVAIVSPHAGTTRDIIEVHLDLGGYPVTLIDTAGIRESDDPVEQEGVRRAQAQAANADLVLWLSVDEECAALPPGAAPVWWVRNKIDLEAVRLAETVGGFVEANLGQFEVGLRQADLGQADIGRSKLGMLGGGSLRISARNGDGLPDLIACLMNFAASFFGVAEGGLIARQRHRVLLRDAASALRRFLTHQGVEELAAEELRIAANALGRLLGRVDVEDVLDVIFRDFCVGK
jgi:tRNA modification GTPase